MAEAPEEQTMPQRGKVQQVCQQWLVHEDGVLAYKMQNEEFSEHYQINRQNRRTVRDDIPVAKLVQSEEEKRQQEERFRELQLLRKQSEKDEEIARRVAEELEKRPPTPRDSEVSDEELARRMQEKEKAKYERYLQKKREKQLKKERERLERELAQHSEEARLVLAQGEGGEQLSARLEDLRLAEQGAVGGLANGHTRVTPAGKIEDDGDFSDFFVPPPQDVNQDVRRRIQEEQDEEMARLLQEQEHKRNKAEVDRNKLRAIEMQDEQLARVMQEQEKLKARKAKAKRQQQKEQKQREKQEQQQGRHMEEAAGAGSSSSGSGVAMGNGHHVAHLYRRDSYTRSISNNAGPIQPSPAAVRTTSEYASIPIVDIGGEDAQEVERWLVRSSLTPSTTPSSHSNTSHSGPSEPGRRRRHDDPLPPSPSPPGSYYSDDELPSGNGALRSGNAVSAPINFNIAAAIDPTYQRRQHELDDSDQTQVKSQIPLSQSLPLSEGFAVTEGELEWDPSLRGSLRHPKGYFRQASAADTPSQERRHPETTLSTLSREAEMAEAMGDGLPVMSQWGPVQGQKRSTLDKRRSKKPAPAKGKEGKGNCKQQ